MFHQVLVAPDDRDCFRYYWWLNGNLDATPVAFRMKVHIFGASSSPSCANFALRQSIEDNRSKFDHNLCEAALQNFYVDDFLCAVADENKAIQMINGIREICQLGGFTVTKWISNSREVLKSIPDDDRATSVADLNFDNFPSERALGVSWNIDDDTLGFLIKLKQCSPTRRHILSIISTIFDPLGIVSPYILPARIILQDLCCRQIGWDDGLSDTDIQVWEQWLGSLEDLKNITVPRCVKPKSLEFGQIVTTELHHFVDASNKGYGTATYLRFINDRDGIYCSLLYGRSRVAPIKRVTIPRMELTAATLAVRVNTMIQRDLPNIADRVFFWTDGMSTMRSILNVSTRFQTFVANRLPIIHEGSATSQWRYVEGSKTQLI